MQLWQLVLFSGRLPTSNRIGEMKKSDTQSLSKRKLVVSISSSALFDLSSSDAVYRQDGLKAYAKYQISHENEPLAPGDAFSLVKKLLRINELLGEEERVEVVLLSRNSADTGLRVFNSIQHHQLSISRAAFTGGAAPFRYMEPFGCNLFLSTNPTDVRDALDKGIAAASILHSKSHSVNPDALHFAFDGDAVIFSDEAEKVYKQDGLQAFTDSELKAADTPLSGGPFKQFLAALYQLQSEFSSSERVIRTALVTARSAPAHERVIKTLRAWQIRLDESLFLGGMNKAEFLKAYGADVFFDDQQDICDEASQHVATGHVPHGVANQ